MRRFAILVLLAFGIVLALTLGLLVAGSPASAVLTPRPAVLVTSPPTSVTNLYASGLYDGQANLQWQIPSTGETPYYAVYAFSYDFPGQVVVVAVPSGLDSTIVSGLQPDYWIFTMTPFNGQWGPWSAWSNWTIVGGPHP